MRLFKRKSRSSVAEKNLTPVQAIQPELDPTILALDIDSFACRAALIRLQPQNFEILSYTKIDLDIQTFKVDNLTNLLVACEQALGVVKQNQALAVKSLIIGFSDDLTVTSAYKIQIRRPSPQLPFSEKEFDQLVSQNQIEALDQAMIQLKNQNPHLEMKLQLLNSSLINLTVDGQQTVNPIGHSVNWATIELYNVFVPKIWSEISRQISQKLNLKLTALAHKPFALVRGFLGDEVRPNLNALVINIETQLTDVTVILNGILMASKSFGLGYQIFGRALSRNFDNSASANETSPRSQTATFNPAQLTASQQKQAAGIINHTVAVWLQGLGLILNDFKIPVLPSKIYLTGQGANWQVFKTSLLKLNKMKTLTFNQPIQIEILTLNQMSGAEKNPGLKEDFLLTTLAGLGRLAHDLFNAQQALRQPAKVASM